MLSSGQQIKSSKRTQVERGMVIEMKYGNEGMDCKKYILLLLQKIWIAVLAALVGGALCGGIYLFVHVVINSNREYQAESKLHLDFAIDESGEVYQAYNGYTWNDLMSTDQILNTTMSYLPDTYTKEEVVAATSAQILSDIRLLTITITTSDPDKTAEILKATDLSLVDLGKREKEFVDIQIYKETEPKVVAVGERLLQAVMLGLLLALIFSLLAMALLYVVNDKIYVPSDLKCVTKLPFAGYCFTNAKKQESEAAAAESSRTDTESTGKKKRERKLYEILQNDLEQNLAHLAKENGTLAKFELYREQMITEETCLELRKSGGVLLIVPYGKMDRTTLNYRIELLTLLGCKVTGILIQDADMRFMKWYYNHL